MNNSGQPLILASGSETRRQMLLAAGVDVVAEKPLVDEAGIKQSLIDQGAKASDLAMALAEVKALSVSRLKPEALVIGGDQILELNGKFLSKAKTHHEATQTLTRLSGQKHRLISAAVIASGGQVIWRAYDKSTLTVRPLSAEFIEGYLQQLGDAAYNSVGCYHIEGLGSQLFERIDGDSYTILGLPLLQMMKYLRDSGILLK